MESLTADSSATQSPAAGPRGILTVVFAAVGVGLLFLLAAFATAMRDGASGLEVGRPAPTFELRTFEGPTVDLSDLRGQVVVLNFWASWCVECEDEAADLEALWRESQDDGLVVMGVAYTDTEPAARAWIERFGVTYPNGPDLGSRISRSYGLTGVPETVVIDKEGLIAPLNVVGMALPQPKFIGPIIPGATFTPRDLRATVDALLATADG